MRPIPRNADTYYLERILKELQGHPQAWAFLQPVKADEVPDYYDVITNPMGMSSASRWLRFSCSAIDLSTMEHKLETNQYSSVEAFVADAQLVFDNCKTYNPEHTIYHRNAIKVEKFLKDQLLEEFKRDG